MSQPRTWLKHPLTWASVIVLVAVVGVIGYVGKNTDDSGTPTQSAAPSTVIRTPQVPTTTTAPGDYIGSDVDALGRGMRIPTNPDGLVLPQSKPSSGKLTDPIPSPAGLEWQKVYGVPMPFTTSDGPTRITEDGVPVGFTRTPQGAAVAALQIMFRATYGPADVRNAVLRTSVIGTEQQKNVLRGATNPAEYQSIPEALRISADQYTTTTAVVRWAFGPLPAPAEHPTSTGQCWSAGEVPLIWEDDQWKLKLTEDVLTSDYTRFIVETLDTGGWSRWF